MYIYAKFTTKAATSTSLGKPLLFKCNNNQWKIPGKKSIFSKAVERKFVALLQMISCPGNFQGFLPINFQKKLLLSPVDRGIAWYFVVFEYLVNWQYQVVYFYQKFGHLDISASVSCHQDWQQNFKIFILTLWFFFKANRKFMSNALQYTYSFACASVSNLLLLKRTLVAINSRIIESV